MAGYIPREREPMTREQKIAAIGAVIAALFMIVSAIAASRAASPLLRQFDFGVAPVGVVQWFLAWTFLVRARADRPEERYSPRTLRLCALALFLLGVMLVAVGLYTHFEGTH